MTSTNEIVLYHSDELSTHIEVRVENETVWLNRNQLASLFERDVKTIGKHIANVLKEELQGVSVVAKIATTASDGKTYQVEHYKWVFRSNLCHSFRSYCAIFRSKLFAKADGEREALHQRRAALSYSFALSDRFSVLWQKLMESGKLYISGGLPCRTASRCPTGFLCCGICCFGFRSV